MLLSTLSEQSPKELAEIEKDQGGDAVWTKARVLRLPDRTLSPHDEIPRGLLIPTVITPAASCSSQGLSGVKTDHLYDTAGPVADGRTASTCSNGGRASAGLTVAAWGGCGRAGIAVHRTCNSGAKELWHCGYRW